MRLLCLACLVASCGPSVDVDDVSDATMASPLYVRPTAMSDEVSSGRVDVAATIEAACGHARVSPSQVRVLCGVGGERPDLSAAAFKAFCLDVERGVVDASVELTRLLSLRDASGALTRKVVLPAVAPDGTSARYKLLRPLTLRTGQLLVGAGAPSRRPTLVWPFDAARPKDINHSSALFQTVCRFTQDRLDSLNLRTAAGLAVSVPHGTNIYPFLVGLSGDCTGLDNLAFEVGTIPEAPPMYDDASGTKTATLGGTPVQLKTCAPAPRTPFSEPGHPRLDEALLPANEPLPRLYPSVVFAGPSVGRFLLTHEAVPGSAAAGAYRTFVAKPGTPVVAPVRFLSIKNVTIGSASAPSKVKGLELGSDRSSSYVLVDRYTYFGDGRSGLSVGVGLNPTGPQSNLVTHLHVRDTTLHGGWTGVWAAGSSDLLLERVTSIDAAVTGLQLHVGDVGLGMRFVKVVDSTFRRRASVRWPNYHAYGLVTVAGRPYSLLPSFASTVPDPRTRPFGRALAKEWTTQRAEYEVREASSGEVTFTNTVFQGESHAVASVGPERLVAEFVGTGNAQRPSALRFEHCQFNGGDLGIDADPFLVQNFFCSTLFKKWQEEVPSRTAAQFKAAFHVCEDPALFSFPPASGQTFPLQQRLPEARRLLTEVWAKGATDGLFEHFKAWEPLSPAVLRAAFDGFELRHSNLVVLGSSFSEQTGPAIALTRGHLHAEGSSFTSNRGTAPKRFLELGGSFDALEQLGTTRITHDTYSSSLSGSFLVHRGLSVRPTIGFNVAKVGSQLTLERFATAEDRLGLVNLRHQASVGPSGHPEYFVDDALFRSGRYQVGDLVRASYPGKVDQLCLVDAAGAFSVGPWATLRTAKRFYVGEQVTGPDGAIYRALQTHQSGAQVLDENGDDLSACAMRAPADCAALWRKVDDQLAHCAP